MTPTPHRLGATLTLASESLPNDDLVGNKNDALGGHITLFEPKYRDKCTRQDFLTRQEKKEPVDERFIGATHDHSHTHHHTLSTPCDPGLDLTTFTCASAFAAVFPCCPLSHLFRAAGVDRFVKATEHNEETKR